MEPVFVVLTDMSAAANLALAYTTRLAEHLAGRLVLLHVYLGIDPLQEPESVLITSPTELASRHQLAADLRQQAQHLPVPAEAEFSTDPLMRAITQVVHRHHPLLLVMGRQQHPSLLDRLVPSRALPVLRDARYPLLQVPEAWTDTALPQRVLVAADGEYFWPTSPALALQGLLAAWQPLTTVVHVAPAAHGPSLGADALETVRRTGLFPHLTANSLYEVREETPADGILQVARELDSQLIVMLARPHTFLGELFHRSVTAQVLRHSPVPVLVLPTMA